MGIIMTNLIFYAAAYLVGSIPFGLLLAKHYAKVDVTKSGSHSIGATNVYRVLKEQNPTLAKKLGIFTIVFDALKGVVVLIVAMLFGAPQETLWAVAVLAVIGHCYSIFLFGDGGKGVATAAGVLIIMAPLAMIPAVIAWGAMAKFVRISSLSSLVGVIVIVVGAYVFYPDIISHAPINIIAFLIFYKHIPNLLRLFSKQEARI
jgi:glycerol-3-phosphate acyltransferase PlsY